jgi:hypothetical protein
VAETLRAPATSRRAQDLLISRALRAHGVRSLFFMLGMGGPDSPAVTTRIEAGIQGYYVRHKGAAACRRS